MPKRNRNRRMKGGFLDSLSNSISSGWNSVSQGASSMWDKTKNAASTAYSSAYTPPAYTPTTPTVSGGKRRTRKMTGGYSSNTSLTGLAATASPISSIKSAQAHNWVGGRTKRKHSKYHKRCQSKSRRHRK